MNLEKKLSRSKRFLFRTIIVLKRIAQSLALVLLLFLIVFLLINSSQFLNWSKSRIIGLLKEQIENRIEYSSLEFNFFRGSEIKDIVIYDHHNDTLLYCHQVNVSFAKNLSSLLKSELSFNELQLKDSRLFMKHYKDEEEDNVEVFLDQFKKSKSKSGKKLAFDLKQIELDQFYLERENENTLQFEKYNVNHLNVLVDRMDLLAKFIQIRELKLDHPVVEMNVAEKNYEYKTKNSAQESDTICKDGFGITCKELFLNDGEFNFNKKASAGFDSLSIKAFNPRRFEVSDIQLSLIDFGMDDGKMNLKSFRSSCKLDDTIEIQSMQCDHLSFNKKELNISKFKVFTENSHIGDSLNIQFGLINEPGSLLSNSFLQLLVRDTRISFGDLLYFVPALQKNDYIRNNHELQAEIAGRFVGKLNSLKAFDLVIDIPNKFEFKGDAFTRNIQLRGEELLNFNIKYLVSSSQFIQSVIPALEKIKVFNRFGKFRYSGRFDGYLEDFVSYGSLNSDLGNLKSDLRLNLRPGNENATWSGSVSLNDFQLGELFHIKNLDKVSLNATIKNGRGLYIEKMNAELEADVSSLVFKSYNYQNLQINAVINKNLFDGEAKIKDKNLDLNFKGKISNLNSVPQFVFTSEIAKADLKALNLIDKTYIVSGSIQSDLKDLDLDKIVGSLSIKNGLIYDYGKNTILHIGNVNIEQLRNEEQVSSLIQSDILTFESKGNYKIKSVYNQLISMLYKQYPDIFSDVEIGHQEDLNPILMDANFEILNLNKISHFLDWNIKADKLYGNFKLDNLSGVIHSEVNGNFIQFNNVKLEKINAQLNGDSASLKSKFTSSGLLVNDKYFTKKINLSQDFHDSKMHFAISARDSLDVKDLLGIKIGSNKASTNKKFYFEGDSLIINASKWYYDKDAFFNIGKNFVECNQFRIFDSISEIQISDVNRLGLQLVVKSFNLSVLNPFMKNGALSFSGLYNVDLRIPNIFKIDHFDGQLNVLNMRINNVSYGRFNINFNVVDPNKPMLLTVDNNYKETSINLNGSINLPLSTNYALPKFDFDLTGSIQGFQLYFLESFITNISNTKGTLDGPLKIYRKNKTIYMDGDLVANYASTKVNYLNTNYFFNNQRVKLKDSLFIFENITITDELNNPILINGTITQNNFNTAIMDMNLKSNKALVLNTKKEDNIYYYGYGMMGFQCSFKGLTTAMDMDFVGKSEKGSKFVIPVRYDIDSKDTKFVTFRSEDTLRAPRPSNAVVIKGLNVRMNVELTEDCEMSIIFDEKSGDILKGNGIGNLQIAALRDNSFTINGNYQINSGQYLFTLLNFVNKPFKLIKGGNINWTGDPLNADVNLDAKYEGLNVSPLPLIEDYLTDPTTLDRAKERTKVDLNMNMSGSLLKPDIQFKLNFPELNGSLRNLIDPKLRYFEQNPELMNQQVATLILFRTFLNTNSNLGILSGVKSTGFNTISEFLSNQVSIFVSNLWSELFDKVGFVSGVDVNVNVDASKTVLGTQSANANEVIFNVRHRFLNDQWAVSLGGNYGNSSAFNQSNYFNPESVIEWNTPVTGLKMRIYYKGVDGIDGVRHRVGSGVSYRKEFNSIKELKQGIKEQRNNNAESSKPGIN